MIRTMYAPHLPRPARARPRMPRHYRPHRDEQSKLPLLTIYFDYTLFAHVQKIGHSLKQLRTTLLSIPRKSSPIRLLYALLPRTNFLLPCAAIVRGAIACQYLYSARARFGVFMKGRGLSPHRRHSATTPPFQLFMEGSPRTPKRAGVEAVKLSAGTADNVAVAPRPFRNLTRKRVCAPKPK